MIPWALVCNLGRPHSRMYCLYVIGRDSWVWGKQKTLYKNNSPHELGEESLTVMDPLNVFKHVDVRTEVIVVVVVVVRLMCACII